MYNTYCSKEKYTVRIICIQHYIFKGQTNWDLLETREKCYDHEYNLNMITLLIFTVYCTVKYAVVRARLFRFGNFFRVVNRNRFFHLIRTFSRSRSHQTSLVRKLFFWHFYSTRNFIDLQCIETAEIELLRQLKNNGSLDIVIVARAM